jgi:hypothetical protein
MSTQTKPTISGMAPLAQTREQSIADSIKSSVNFQQQFPYIDVEKALIEPIINFTFDMQVRNVIFILQLHLTLSHADSNPLYTRKPFFPNNQNRNSSTKQTRRNTESS